MGCPKITLALALLCFLAASADGRREDVERMKKRQAEDCVWNKDTEFPAYPPLLMNKDSWMSILPILEENVREVRIAAGSTVVIACPKTTINATGTEVTEGVCEGGKVLNVGGSKYTMIQLTCKSRVKESLKKFLGVCGDNGSQQHTIGFTIPGYSFYELVRICFNQDSESALYTTHLLRGESVTASDSNPSRPSFRSDTGFYTVSPNNCYSIENQDQMMLNLLGDDLIEYSDSLYFARGHLSPDADFHTEMEADATYYYINAVPQWQSFNGGNWKSLEYDVRSLAADHDTDLKIWTGFWKVLKMEDSNNTLEDIYLGYVENEEVILAPELMWKVIYENSTNRGVAVVGMNNPYTTTLPTPICEDICDQVPWIDFNFDNLVSGATYCCTVQDLRSVVPYAPDLGNAGLLIN